MPVEQAQRDIGILRAQAQAGEIELAYLDEVGLSQVPSKRSAWTLRDHRHIIDAPRGKQPNVMAVLLSRGDIFNAKVWFTYNGELFAAFLALLRQHLGKPVTVIHDNARTHTAKAIQPYVEPLKAQGTTLYFLPPCRPGT